MHNGTRRQILALLLAAGMGSAVWAQQGDAPDPFSEATIRVKGFAKVPPGQPLTGAAKLRAVRAAETIARRNLVALFGHLEISGDERVKKIVARGFVSGARRAGDPVVKNGWLIVTLEVPLSAIAGNMADLEAKAAAARQRNEQLQQALGTADAGLAKMKKTLDNLKTAIDKMEKKLEERKK
ncbi:MAG: hypothetical protein GXP25_17395 [Planctomycetes bacterium]|nr:hypothetical protein [Planctomycetota bacterium]